jgi:hypothetical protein
VWDLKNTGLWEAQNDSGPVERLPRFDPPLQGSIFANDHALALSTFT